jgi:hypothetical protein
MAIKSGHKFHADHGFTGSAGKDMRPKIPGFKHGGMDHAEGAREHFSKSGHKDHDGEMHTSEVHYDDHGFQHHKKGGRVE